MFPDEHYLILRPNSFPHLAMINQGTDIFDRDADLIPILEIDGRFPKNANPRRRPGQNHITGEKSEVPGKETDQEGDRKNHPASVAALHGHPVHPATDIQVLGLGNIISGYNPWPQGAKSIQ